MAAKLFVGGLASGIDNARLRAVFAAFGYVAEARVMRDDHTGRSKGFGYVVYEHDVDARRGLLFDGRQIDGRTVRVDMAVEPRRRPRKPQRPRRRS